MDSCDQFLGPMLCKLPGQSATGPYSIVKKSIPPGAVSFEKIVVVDRGIKTIGVPAHKLALQGAPKILPP